jgi:methylated-DNA-[protein]-cysteine S-methyltransferase
MIDCVRKLTPLGEMLLASDGSALCGAWFAGQKYFPVTAGWREQRQGEDTLLEKAAEELDLYFAGELRRFSISLRPRGTSFQQKVWTAITEIGYGHTASYGDLAERVKSSPRAVGAATGRNPASLFIPCHRVLGIDGRLTGYAGGLDRKKALLEGEGVNRVNSLSA